MSPDGDVELFLLMEQIKLVVPNFSQYEHDMENYLKCRFPVLTHRINLAGLPWGLGICFNTFFPSPQPTFPHFIFC